MLVSALILLVCLSVDLDVQRPLASRGLAVLLIVAMWWISEALPLTITSLFPICLYPMLAVASPGVLASKFFGGTSFLFIGGFFIGLAIERWGLHTRIICAVVCYAGKRVDCLVGGFLGAVWLLSMWISNTATAVCMMPVVHSFLVQLPREYTSFKSAVLMAVGWAASIGGIATPVGTPTNGVFLDQYLVLWPDAPAFTFAKFTLCALPLSFLLILGVWLAVCCRYVWFSKERIVIDTAGFQKMRQELGPMSYEEIVVALDLVLLILLWFTAAPIGAFPAFGTTSSGLAAWVAERLAEVGGGELVFILLVSFVICMTTEVVSNMSTMAIFGVIIAATADLKGYNAVQMMLLACFCSSTSFMLPTASGPNMVVYGTGLIPVKTMVQMGLLLNFGTIIVLAFYVPLIMPALLGGDYDNLGTPVSS